MRARFNRQSFLGANSEKIFAALNVGVVGLGGGGSHIAQQLAHIGVGHFTIADPDHVEDTNLNRLVGATWQDGTDKTPKVRVAERMITGVNPNAGVLTIKDVWQSGMLSLRSVDVIVGGVDTYKERDELERFARRFLIPYIDLGMDVHALSDGAYVVGGQVVLSMPGHLCLWCMGILTEERLAEEARRYGDVGGRPQVIWPNGVLASVAVGLFVQLMTPWHSNLLASAYLEYDGNRHTVQSSNRLLPLAGIKCAHYPSDAIGDPFSV